MSSQYPSLFQLKCPNCGNTKYIPLGKKRSGLKQFFSGFFAGAAPMAASATANQKANSLTGVMTLQYQCTQCKKKYEFTPLQANDDEILDNSSSIRFERAKMFRGAAGVYTVYLNGVPLKNLSNGESFSFQTNIKYNTIFVGFGDGIIFRNYYSLEAESGGNINIVFDGNFRLTNWLIRVWLKPTLHKHYQDMLRYKVRVNSLWVTVMKSDV